MKKGVMQVKELSKLIGTIYIYNGMATKLISVLNSIDENEVLDISYCRFGPETLAVLERYHGSMTFVNTKEPALDEILKRNKNVMTAPKLKGEQLDVRVYSGKELFAYLKDFDRTKSYYIDDSVYGPDEVRTICLATIITLTYPDVIIDMKTFLGRMFKHVRELWIHHNTGHSVYNEVINSSLMRRELVNGSVYIPCDGNYTEQMLVESKNVLPVEFGEVPLSKSTEFSNVLSGSIDTLLSVSKNRPVRMKDKIALWEE